MFPVTGPRGTPEIRMGKGKREEMESSHEASRPGML